MENVSNSVEEKILLAAIDCFDKYGFQGTTNRRIAEMAGTNSAAINYYFRSKDVLIQKVMERTLANAFDWKDFSEIQATSGEERCIAIFDHLIAGGVNYPGITRAHFSDLINYGRYDSPIVKNLNEFVHRLCDDLETHGVPLERKKLESACMQMTSTVFFMALFPEIYAHDFNIDLSLPEQRIVYLTELVERLLH